MSLLELNNLTYRVNNGTDSVNIIDGVSLKLEEGMLTVVTGPNGGGKTSLAKLIMGIEMPTSGSIKLNGEDITTLPVHERAQRGISYAFQQPPRIKGINVSELLGIAAGSDLQYDLCCRYLTAVGLCSADYLYRDLDSSLSGGEMKRIEIATILARKTKISIFDEPEAGIDLWSFAKLTETFKKIHGENGGAIIIISHQERILELADEIVVLSGGKVEQKGTKDEILPKILGEVQYQCGYMKEEVAL
jgi:Fe-S cluster assembly ATP-binding protein